MKENRPDSQNCLSKMNDKLNWDEYRIALLIAEAGSLSEAARRGELSHPTLFRRINALERKLGVRLFERFRGGYQPTSAGEEILAVARKIAEMTNETERRISGRDLRPTGLVRIATTDSLMFGLLAPEIARFRSQEPGMTLEIIASNKTSDLALREADIAIRPTSTPDEYLVGRKLGAVRHGIYARRHSHLSEVDPQNLKSSPWVGPSPSMPYSQLHAWMRKNGLDNSCICSADTVLGLYAAVRVGCGLSVLPSYLAEQDRELARIGSYIEEVTVDLWLLTHPDLRHTARVSAVLGYFAQSEFIKAQLAR